MVVHKLNRKGVKPIIVKSHGEVNIVRGKNQTKKCRGMGFVSFLKRGNASAIRKIYFNENLTSYRRELPKQANQKRKDGLLVSARSIDGKIFIKTSSGGQPLRVYDKNDL